MEVRVYKTLSARLEGKHLFCARVDCPDTFSFENCISTFRSIYGSGVVIEFLIV